MIVKILEIKRLTHDVKRFRVERPEGYKFVPGQATDVAINKFGYKDTHKPFTFTGLVDDPFLEFTIKGYPTNKFPNHDGITEKIHTLTVGDSFIIEDPWGAIHYEKEGYFIAGGAGVTPFIAILKNLKAKNKTGGNKLLFSNKLEKDIILEVELVKILGKKNVVYTLTQEKKKGYESGRIDEKFINKYVVDFGKSFYVCGPGKFVGDIKSILRVFGVISENLVFEK